MATQRIEVLVTEQVGAFPERKQNEGLVNVQLKGEVRMLTLAAALTLVSDLQSAVAMCLRDSDDTQRMSESARFEKLQRLLRSKDDREKVIAMPPRSES